MGGAIRWYLRRRGVPDDILRRVERLPGVDDGFWVLLLRFLVEHGLPALIEFLRTLLDDGRTAAVHELQTKTSSSDGTTDHVTELHT